MPKWFFVAISGAGAALAEYWRAAPPAMHVAVYALGPLMMLESISAIWMQRAARRPHPEVQVEVYTDDQWYRAGQRTMITCLLVCLAAILDAISGSRHVFVLWALLWGVGGQARATHRHLTIIARIYHFQVPVLPQSAVDSVSDKLPKVEREEHR